MLGLLAAMGGSALFIKTHPTAAAPASGNGGATAQVSLVRTPKEGIQPQAVRDSKGVLHLIYLRGDPAESDVYYARQEPGRVGFSPPVRVNSQPGSAVALGTIRGPQIAVGKDGRVHVAWNGSGKASPKPPGDGSPMLYTRSNAAGTAFEPQRNLMRATYDLDGGGTLAADGAGNVYVAWHAGTRQGGREADRRLWMTVSNDGGDTFSGEKPAYDPQTGACGCCGTRAFVDGKGTLYVLYRAATKNVERDMYLLASRDRGGSFQGANIHRWNLNACPMSSESFAEGPGGVVGAWETKEQVYFGRIDPESLRMGTPVPAPGPPAHRKYPSVATNARGETLLAWAEGASWAKGGDLVWQVFDRNGQPTSEKGRVAGGIPKWGYAAAVARPDGGFTLYH